MSIGLCCQYVEPRNKRDGSKKYVNILEERNLQFGLFMSGKYNEDRIIDTYINNVQKLIEHLPGIISKGINSFRVSSNLLPLIDRVPDHIRYNSTVLNKLNELGRIILNNKIRFSCHPDPFCLLNSNNPNVIKNSIEILTHHAWIFDRMGLPQTNYYAINIHGGVKNQFKTLVNSINALPSNVRSRMTLENEELAYNVEDLYTIHKETGISIVFDSHHHSFNPGNLCGHEAMELAMSTWKEKPLTHLSNTEPGLENSKFQDRRKHSNYVHYIPEYQLKANNDGKIDVDFEFKMKNEAVFKAVKDFGIIL
jgi:UV DNA damage endonuclease